jgi:hypothetical protein
VLEGRRLPSTVINLNDAGTGSLRDAIASTPSGGTVDFQTGLTGTIVLTTGELAISKNLTIAGPGADVITVSGNHASRVFNIGAGFTVRISGLTIADGSGAGGVAGGIFNAGTLSLTDCTIGNNYAQIGGGGISNCQGTLTVSGCILSGDSTAPGLSSGGGAIENVGGMLTVSNSTFVGNVSEQGGGILNNGTLMVSDSSFSQNHAGWGGGIFNVFGTGTVTNSTFSGNFADTAAGFAGGGVANSGYATLTIAGCTLTGNSAGTMSNFGVGGGIRNENGSRLTLSDSTLYGNSANSGGGISNGLATLTVTNSTLSGNSATSADGGGIWSSGGLDSRNTIIAGNTGSSRDLFGNLGSLGHNLIGNTQSGSGFDPTDLLGVDPLLGPLQDNGGPTQTMALLAGSPALNAGDSTQLGVADQRGVVRSGGVNIGAYQASASAFVLTAQATATAGTPFDATVQAVDPFGQTALGYTGTVHFDSSDGQPILPGDYSFVVADNGAHTFPGGVTLKTAGNQTVTATDTATASITGSATVAVNPAAADHLLFQQQPTDTAAGETIAPAVTVAVVDQFGNVLTDDNTDTVTISIGADPSGGTAMLGGTLTVTVSGGIATFSDLSIDLAGDGYTLHATTGASLPDFDSSAFSIT